MVNQNEATPFVAVVINNRQRGKVAKGTEVEVLKIGEGKYGLYALCRVEEDESEAVFLNPNNLATLRDVSPERKAEIEAERAAFRSKSSEMLPLCQPQWESERAIGIDVMWENHMAKIAGSTRVFLPKSQIKNGGAPRWLIEAKLEEILARGRSPRTHWNFTGFVARVTIFPGDTPKNYLYVKEDKVHVNLKVA
jgi:hypothetical protein